MAENKKQLTFLQKSSIAKGNYKLLQVDDKGKRRLATKDEVEQFIDYLKINSKFASDLREMELSSEFFKANQLLKEVIPKEIQEDVFYSAKNGEFKEGVPARVVYELKKIAQVYDTPNVILSVIDASKNNLFEWLQGMQQLARLEGSLSIAYD